MVHTVQKSSEYFEKSCKQLHSYVKKPIETFCIYEFFFLPRSHPLPIYEFLVYSQAFVFLCSSPVAWEMIY